jgi:hypothetical protein
MFYTKEEYMDDQIASIFYLLDQCTSALNFLNKDWAHIVKSLRSIIA